MTASSFSMVLGSSTDTYCNTYFGTQQAVLNFEICGYETVSVTATATAFEFYNRWDYDIDYTLNNVTSVFSSSSTTCVVNSYELWKDAASGPVSTTDTTVPWSHWITVDSTTGVISVKPSLFTGTKETIIYQPILVAKTIGGVSGSKPLNFNFTLIPTNKAP